MIRQGWGILLLCAACQPFVAVPGAEDEDEGTTGAATSPPLITTATTAGPPTVSSTTGVSTGTTIGDPPPDESSGGNETNNFITGLDGTSCFSCECDIWAQDCPRGEKCNPWANDGGNSWNSVRCVPIDKDPGAPGDPCTAEGSPVSGIDTCEQSAMCWNVDLETLEGTCIGFCGGDESDPVCPAGQACQIANEGVLPLCLPTCDPLADDCAEGEACMLIDENFSCQIDLDPGPYGTPCEFLATCGHLLCAPSELMVGVGNCDPDNDGCCTHYCDLTAIDPDAPCPDQALGQACIPLWDADPPMGLEHVGFCAIE